jgi:hypothetical protein
MPLRRLPETPLPAPAGPLPGTDPSQPAAPSSASPPSALAEPQASLPTAPIEAPTPSQLQVAARELAQAAERTERHAREILSRAMALSDQLAKSLDRGQRRTPAGGLAMLLSATLLCAASAALSTLVTLAAVHPQVSLLDLLRILWHRG